MALDYVEMMEHLTDMIQSVLVKLEFAKIYAEMYRKSLWNHGDGSEAAGRAFDEHRDTVFPKFCAQALVSLVKAARLFAESKWGN